MDDVGDVILRKNSLILSTNLVKLEAKKCDYLLKLQDKMYSSAIVQSRRVNMISCRLD